MEAYCLELCTLKMKSILGLSNLVQHLAGYVEVFGAEVESDLTQVECNPLLDSEVESDLT